MQLAFTDVALTSYAGLELFGRYLRATGFNATVRHAVAGMPAWGDFGAVAIAGADGAADVLVQLGRRVDLVCGLELFGRYLRATGAVRHAVRDARLG